MSQPQRSTTPGAPVLEVEGLKAYFKIAGERKGVSRGLVHAVDGVDLQLLRGEVLGLVGESGCGKSTLARCIVGLEAIRGGEIRYEGTLLGKRRTQEQRKRIQIVFQDPYSSLNPRMTVRQTIEELLRVHRLVPRAKIPDRSREMIVAVGLGDWALDAYPSQLSGGQRQRVSIARALVVEPDVLIADEPVSALDVSIQASIINLLRNLQKQFSLSVLFISHNLAVVRHTCDRISVMYLGKIVEEAPTEKLFQNPRHPYTQALLSAIPRLQRVDTRAAPAIVGELPSQLNLPSGCRFHTRCPIAASLCTTEEPQLLTESPSESAHRAACHFAWTDEGKNLPEISALKGSTPQD